MALQPEPQDPDVPDAFGTRERLLAAAETLFAHHGYAGTSIRQVAAAAGVDLGCIRYHVGAKADLLEATVLRAYAGLRQDRLESLEDLLERSESPTVEEVFDAFFAPTVRFLTGPHGDARSLLGLRGIFEHEAFWPSVRQTQDYQHLFWELFAVAAGLESLEEARRRFVFASFSAHLFLIPSIQNREQPEPPTPERIATVRAYALAVLKSDELDLPPPTQTIGAARATHHDATPTSADTDPGPRP